MTLGEHLDDLRRRVILAALGLLPIFAIALFFGRPALETLIVPVQHALREAGLPATLQATSPLETFLSYVKVSVIMAAIVGSPWVLYQLWLFVSPGLYNRERRFVYVIIPMSTAMSIAGLVFLYFVLLPVVLSFFITFGSSLGGMATPTVDVAPGVVFPTVPTLMGDPGSPQPGQIWFNAHLMQLRMAMGSGDGAGAIVRGIELTKGYGIAQQYRVSEYISMLLNLAIAFAIGFQMPVVVLLLGWSGLLDRKTLVKFRKHAMFACALASAILTPADPLSMLLLAGPLYLLYELGGVLLILMPAQRITGEQPEDEA